MPMIAAAPSRASTRHHHTAVIRSDVRPLGKKPRPGQARGLSGSMASFWLGGSQSSLESGGACRVNPRLITRHTRQYGGERSLLVDSTHSWSSDPCCSTWARPPAECVL